MHAVSQAKPNRHLDSSLRNPKRLKEIHLLYPTKLFRLEIDSGAS
jgi:hypothetical protein